MADVTKTKLRGNILNDAIIKEVGEFARDIKFGQILITVHNSRIVQVDRTERSRYDSLHQYLDEGEGI